MTAPAEKPSLHRKLSIGQKVSKGASFYGVVGYLVVAVLAIFEDVCAYFWDFLRFALVSP